MKKCGLLKILHEKYRLGSAHQKPPPEVQEFLLCLQVVTESNREIAPHTSKAQEVLNPLRVLNLFRNIPTQVKPLCAVHSDVIWVTVPPS